MVLIWPGSLFGLLVVGVVAAWALFRPSRRLAVVGSLSLWQEALGALDRSARRSTRRVTATWVFLLAGAAAAIFALARPVAHLQGRGRRISLAVFPSAEFAQNPKALNQAVNVLLDRLGPEDQAQLLRPASFGGATGWMSPDKIDLRVPAPGLEPVPAGRMTIPEAHEESQHTYWFVPAGTEVEVGPNATVIELPAELSQVTIEAAGAAESAAGKVQLFVALRNHSQTAWTGGLGIAVATDGNAGAAWRPLQDSQVTIAPGGRAEIVRDLPAAAAVHVEVRVERTFPAGHAYLARRAGRKRKVALVGRDEPLLRRYVQADEALEPVGSPAEADVVIANGTRPPAGTPSVVIHPPTPPPGWRRREAALSAVVLDKVNLAAADPVMRGVNLESVAVRRVQPWVRANNPSQKVLASLGEEAIILRDLAAGPAGPDARRVYVAFEISADNTNLGMSEAFAVFLANAVRWLAPAGDAQPTYEYLTPWAAAPGEDWKRIRGPKALGQVVKTPPWPGVFRDETGALRAVSLLGLSGGQPERPPGEAIAAAPLPEPVPLGRQVELWPILAAVAIGLWMTGWALRVK